MFGVWRSRAILTPRVSIRTGLHQREGFSSYGVKILVAGMGGGFGLGRYEAILLGALDAIAHRDGAELSCLWRRAHEPYLCVPAGYAKRDSRETRRPRFAYDFLRTALTMRPDIVIFTIPNLAPLALALSVLRPSARVVVCTHGIEVWSRLPWTRRVALQRATRVVASATYNAERITAVQGVRPERIVLIHLALPPSWDGGGSPRDDSGDPSDNPTVLSVARLDAAERYKGVDGVIRALPEVRRQVQGVTYRVIGGGTDLERLQRLARECGVADAVRFVGAVDHANLLREYQRCDVFALPSTGEGFGLVFLEAMSFGKPIVAIATGGPTDIVEDRKTGRLLESPDEIADALLELLLHREEAKKMGARGRTRLEDAFSFERYLARWRETLHTVLAEPT
jgi:phosphatidyl-myo-inositol dimannoside synthase